TNGLAKGKVTLSDEQDDVVLEPKGLLNLKVTASQDTEQNRLTVRIKWRTDPEIPKNRKLIVSGKKGQGRGR
ncbi:MAG TPA: amphi-Trp domain-containing protein, partial [Rhodospirillales bacterium]|nr:amphi-Trp domain-containing protein [Rhodospirillales bacterium]